jgi:pyruvate dehydrogenase E2 component (dihydrolipoamide acetyltransferase)
MAEAIIMPKTGMAMEEGTIIEWLVAVGDLIEVGTVVAEIETDKSTMELESDSEGTLLRIDYDAGETVPVTLPIAWVGKTGEELPPEPGRQAIPAAGPEAGKQAAPAPQEPTPGRVKATPAARKAAAREQIDLHTVAASGRYGEIRERDVRAAEPKRVTPLAARMAEAQQIDVRGVSGSGWDGKVFSADLKAADQQKSTVQAAAVEDELVPLTTIQKITGRRMLESSQGIPSVTEHTRADVTSLLAMRAQINEDGAHRLTINDFVLLAVVRALSEHRRMNAVFQGDSLLYKGSIHLGMAVATPRGLLVPVIRDADHYTLSGLSARARDLAENAREGHLSPDELSGSTFSVTNVGMMGITAFTPIINPPEVGILGVCSIEEVLALKEGSVIQKRMMGLSLSFDHRAVDGAEASYFLKAVREYLESPLSMLI